MPLHQDGIPNMTAFDSKFDSEIPDSRDFSAQFSSIAKREQNRSFYIFLFVTVSILAWVPVSFGHSSRVYIIAVIIPFCVVGAGITLWSVATKGRLKCPSCSHRFEVLERHCPECGADGLHRASTVIPKIDRTMHCDSCGKDFMPGSGMNRMFKIRYCGHCGVFLNNDGV
jgi:hypothetical protein